MDIKLLTFRQWLRQHEQRDDGVGEMATWVSGRKDYPNNSEYRAWTEWYFNTRGKKSKSQIKSRMGDFDRAWYEYMYDTKMKIWTEI